jgi:hypothetical protein
MEQTPECVAIRRSQVENRSRIKSDLIHGEAEQPHIAWSEMAFLVSTIPAELAYYNGAFCALLISSFPLLSYSEAS